MGAAISLAPDISLMPARAQGAANPALTRVNRKFLPTTDQVQAWHVIKDSKGGPTMSGSPSWQNYMQLLEKEWRAAGVVDIFRNTFPFTRWFTTEFPDDSQWSLHVDGKK